MSSFIDVEVLPVPVACDDVTCVGVTTMTLEDRIEPAVRELDEVLVRTGPLTPEVFVVVAFVVDVAPFTTVTGPFAPEVPAESMA